jgi:hypothetical protein
METADQASVCPLCGQEMTPVVVGPPAADAEQDSPSNPQTLVGWDCHNPDCPSNSDKL